MHCGDWVEFVFNNKPTGVTRYRRVLEVLHIVLESAEKEAILHLEEWEVKDHQAAEECNLPVLQMSKRVYVAKNTARRVIDVRVDFEDRKWRVINV